MEELEKLFKKPETIKEKLEDLWFTITYCFPRDVRDFWRSLKCFFHNLKRYRWMLWNDCDFDFGYLDEIIYMKLEFMANYFRTSRIVVNEEKIYDEICLAIKLAKIFMEKEETDYTGYINDRNIRRFNSSFNEHIYKDRPDIYKTILKDLRRLKARHCFYRLLEEKARNWWD